MDNKQQTKKQEIIKTIISILAYNNLTIQESIDILNTTSKKLSQQSVKPLYWLTTRKKGGCNSWLLL